MKKLILPGMSLILQFCTAYSILVTAVLLIWCQQAGLSTYRLVCVCVESVRRKLSLLDAICDHLQYGSVRGFIFDVTLE